MPNDSIHSTADKTALAPSAPKVKVVILYRRNAQPDEQLLGWLERELTRKGCQLFIDRHRTIGMEWAREIEREIRTADTVIALLSAHSIQSEMLAFEIEIAREAAQIQNGRPKVLPVWVNYDGPLPELFAAVLGPSAYTLWQGPQDNERVADDLLKALQRATASPAAPTQSTPRSPSPPQSRTPSKTAQEFEPVGGAVPLTSRFYVARPADGEFRSAIVRNDSIVLVKGARQTGKTSLLARGLQQARERGAKVILTDLQKLNASHLESAGKLYLAWAGSITEQLDLQISSPDTWDDRRGANVNFERFLRREVLDKLKAPLVWGMDEVDRLFNCQFGNEVFALFRSWHNERALDPRGPWAGLTLAIAYATEAHLFISDMNQSPFNVGTRLALDNFTREQVADLNTRFSSPLRDQGEIARFHRLVNGQPYLVTRGLHEMATHKIGIDELELQADRDEGMFGDHLRRLLVSLAKDPELCSVLRDVLGGKGCPTPDSFYRLRSAGVLAGTTQREVSFRCQIYATYLARHLL